MRWGQSCDKGDGFALDACHGILPTWQARSEMWGKPPHITLPIILLNNVLRLTMKFMK